MRVIIVFLLLIAAPTFADQPSKSLSGSQWLSKVNLAMKTLSYHGTVIFLKNGQLETMKYQHGFENGTEFERLTSVNSPLREVIRKASEISCHFKETSKTIDSHHPIDRSLILNLPLASQRLETQYLMAATDHEMVALRPTQIIAVLPKDELRYARKIWVDRESYLPLKVEVYDPQGNTLEEVMFTDIAMDSADGKPQSLIEQGLQQLQQRHSEDSSKFEKSAFKLQNWPGGYEMVFFTPNTLQNSKKAVDHLLMTDGFANISVYFETKGPDSVEGLHSFGSVNSFSRIIGHYQVTALGEVPAKTVEFIVTGVALR
jgi:sigma-E factor negative regulatory protein RseB